MTATTLPDRRPVSRLARLALTGGILACTTASATSLQGSEWKPLRMGELEVPEASSAFLQFRSKGRLVGFSGCNRLMAEYETEQNHILVGPVAATRKLCAETVMQREAALAAALEGARTYLRGPKGLVLFDQHGEPVLELRQTNWD